MASNDSPSAFPFGEAARQLRIWVVSDHEPLPIDPGDRRLMRVGMLTRALAGAGHQTTWFTSSFDHYLKRQRGLLEGTITLSSNLFLRVLPAPSYRKNVDLARIVHNIAFARKFRHGAKRDLRPDVIVAAIPTTEAAAASVRVAAAFGVPCIIDICDPWPDSFSQLLPRTVATLGAPIIALLDRQARFACAKATSLVGTSGAYLRWGQAKGGRSAENKADIVLPLGYAPRAAVDGPERAALLRRLGVEPGQRIVSFVGSWGLSHDFSLVAAVAGRLRERKDIHFVLAGNAESQPALGTRLAQCGNVSLPGWLDAGAVGTLLSASDIGLLPYRRSAPQDLPNKFFEYMAYGAYQIATLGGETARLLAATGTGHSVDCTSEAVTEAIREHLRQPDSAERRQQRIDVFRRDFDGSAIYGRMVRHIENLVMSELRIRSQEGASTESDACTAAQLPRHGGSAIQSP